MEFDIHSMKQRAKGLMGTIKPSPWIAGVIFCIMALVYEIVYCVLAYITGNDGMRFLLYWAIAELVYLNLRSSCSLYGLIVAREQESSISDCLAAFKEKPVSYFILGVIKDFCYCIGIMFCFVGFFVPFYLFRFSVYVIKDENVGTFQALGKSAKLLKGHYVELIKLDISNLGWFLVVIFTYGIANFFVKPYLALVYAEFYDYLKAQQELFG